MRLTQIGDTVTLGHRDMPFTFRNSKITAERFKASDVESARSQLLARYPSDAVNISRHADRVLSILA
jgi:hypothetical protein